MTGEYEAIRARAVHQLGPADHCCRVLGVLGNWHVVAQEASVRGEAASR